MIGLISAGQMRHHQHRPRTKRQFGNRGPFADFHAQPVHPGVQLNAEGMARQAFEMARHLTDGIEHRRQHQVCDHFGIAAHVATEHADFRIGTKRLAHRGAFLGDGDEKLAGTGAGQRARHFRRPKAIAIGLDHGGGFNIRHRVKRAPVRHEGVNINSKEPGTHGRCFDRRAGKVKRKG